MRTDPNGDSKEYSSLANAAESNSTTSKSIRKACKSGEIFRGYYYHYLETSIAGEIWIMHPLLPIECSDMGRIRFQSSRISFGGKNGKKASYLRIHIGSKWYLVHRLIAEAFLENPEGKPTVDHIDRNRENNRLENLRWASYWDQQQNRSDR